jgi:predicted secreted acid phosphatase
MKENKANSIFDNENIQAVIKDLDENVLNTLLGDGNNIKDNIAEALEGFLKAVKRH